MVDSKDYGEIDGEINFGSYEEARNAAAAYLLQTIGGCIAALQHDIMGGEDLPHPDELVGETKPIESAASQTEEQIVENQDHLRRLRRNLIMRGGRASYLWLDDLVNEDADSGSGPARA